MDKTKLVEYGLYAIGGVSGIATAYFLAKGYDPKYFMTALNIGILSVGIGAGIDACSEDSTGISKNWRSNLAKKLPKYPYEGTVFEPSSMEKSLKEIQPFDKDPE